jgi:transketolase
VNDSATGRVSERAMANAIRALSMDAVQAAKSGHPGMPMGMADVATVLFNRFLKFDASEPDWPDRDRFVLSAGHGSMLLYSLLHLTGYADMTLDEIRNFRQTGRRTAGHPEYGHARGIETTTGPLGQGIANAVGMALAERILAARFGDVVDHHTYVIAGDGCLMEGVSHEAASLAGHLKLNRLIVLFDDNGISIDGPTSLAESDDTLKRFEAYGWAAERVDGHDHEAVAAAIKRARKSDRPTLIACKTVIGFGSPNKQGTAATHGNPLGDEEIALVRKELDWPHKAFEIPGDVTESWRAAGRRGAETRKAWQKQLDAMGGGDRAEWDRRMSGDVSSEAHKATADHIASLIAEPQTVATRKASELALEALTAALPEMIGGSADLTGSNNTRTKPMKDITPGDYAGSYVRYGVREHGMAAAMNGMALHGGVIPFGGTFLVFTDYCRPSIRLAALMGIRTIYVMTHDSIGLGEDGPTHQPVEHLAALRAIPNLNVFRPADTVETAECWELALCARTTPSVIALTRQNLPQVRTEASSENLSGRGAYVLAEADGEHRATVVASGSEVEIALAARDALQADGIGTRVVSAPSWERFAAQDEAYRNNVLDRSKALVAIEAASTFGWRGMVGDKAGIVGMTSFGASGPYKELYEHFGITAEAVAVAVRERL